VRLARWIANVLWVRPLRRKRWHPLSKTEQKQARAERRRTKTAPPGGRRIQPLSLRWWAGRASDGSKRLTFDLRVLTPVQLVALRATAIEHGYTGRAWRTGDEYSINEAAFIFVRGGLELPNGEVIGDLIVSQPEFIAYDRRGTDVPTGRLTVRRHVLHVHKSDWRRLRRASGRDEREAYLTLEGAVPLDRIELEPW
jgi:hypothetical protein